MTNPTDENIRTTCHVKLDEWLGSCTRGGKISRNTVAIGIVVLDHIRQFGQGGATKESIISQGGEIKGARSGLTKILEKYQISSHYLREATTRQSHQDGQRLLEIFEWGNIFNNLSQAEKDVILQELIQRLRQLALTWLERKNLRLNLDRRHSPTAWIHRIVESAKSHSGGVVEQHLIGAKLERRYMRPGGPGISNYPAHAGDVQTAREGDFSILKTVYHVTASPGRGVVQKCAANIQAGKFPILLVPAEQEYKAKALAQDEGVDQEMAVISIESFIALNIIELAVEENKDFFSVLQEIVAIYNRRLAEVETDLSLQIEVE